MTKLLPIKFSNKFYGLYLVTHLTLIAILGNIRAFAPDEESYVDAFQNLYRSDFSLGSYGGWWNAQINFLRILYAPPKILSFLPISDLSLLRFYATGLFLFGLFLLVRISNLNQSNLGKTALCLATFTPSIFLWTTLAIKESFIFFFLITFFLGLRFVACCHLTKGLLVCFFSGYSLLNLKGYLYVVLTLSLLLVLFYRTISSLKLTKHTILLLGAITLPYALAPATSVLMIESAIGFGNELSDFRIVDEIYQADSEQADSEQADSEQADSEESQINLGMTMNLLKAKQNQNSIFNSLLNILNLDDYLKDKGLKYESLSSVDLVKIRSLDPANPTDLGPFLIGVKSFLLYPNPLRNNGSPILDLLGLESLLWLALYSLFLIGIFKYSKQTKRLDSTCLLSFCFGFLLMSEMTEINLGTAIRHRSIFALLIVIFISTLATRRNLQALTSD